MRLFKRRIDAGHGWQEVVIDEDRRVVGQRIRANTGFYTGEGNPEFVGLKTREIPHFWRKFREVGDIEEFEWMLMNDEIGVKVNGDSIYVIADHEISEVQAWEVLEMNSIDLGEYEFVERDLSLAIAEDAAVAYIFHKIES